MLELLLLAVGLGSRIGLFSFFIEDGELLSVVLAWDMLPGVSGPSPHLERIGRVGAISGRRYHGPMIFYLEAPCSPAKGFL
jgi:hypothetical protein